MNANRRAARPAGPPETRPKPAPPTTASIPVQQPARAGRPARRGQGGPRKRRRQGGGSRLAGAVVFIGPMAAGKTSLGKRVARELGVPFVDSDALFVRRHGNIADFFERRGEPEFRRIEAELIAEELAKPVAKVLALGGGAVLAERTRGLLLRHPVVLLLTTQEAVLRTANLDKRPLLRDDPEAWGRILEERLPLYEEVANITYRTDRGTKDQLARRIAHWARTFPKGKHD